MIGRAILTAFGLTNGALVGGALLLVSVEGAVAQAAVGPNTPVSGITVGAIFAGILTGGGFLYMVWTHGARFGQDVGDFKAAAASMSAAAPIVAANTKAVAELEGQIAALNARIERAEEWQRTHESIIVDLRRRMSA